jgi:membrane associated rhomboid family serine protease
MSSGGPDLFVVCKSCRSEVSPYITECPYCGARLRKRAPKLDRGGRPAEPKGRRRPPRPSLGRLRPGEIPGIRADAISRPYVTIVAVVACLVLLVLWRAGLFDITDAVIFGKPGDEWWRVLTAPFIHSNTGYAFVALCGLGLFGMLFERRHGHAITLGVLLLAGAGGMLVSAAIQTAPVALGANGAALGLLAAWSIPPLLELRAGEEPEADLIGAAVFAAVIVLLPAVVPEADWIAGLVGGLLGLLVGFPLARLARA